MGIRSKDGSDGSEGSEGKEGGNDRMATPELRKEELVNIPLNDQFNIYNVPKPRVAPMHVFTFD